MNIEKDKIIEYIKEHKVGVIIAVWISGLFISLLICCFVMFFVRPVYYIVNLVIIIYYISALWFPFVMCILVVCEEEKKSLDKYHK